MGSSCKTFRLEERVLTGEEEGEYLEGEFAFLFRRRADIGEDGLEEEDGLEVEIELEVTCNVFGLRGKLSCNSWSWSSILVDVDSLEVSSLVSGRMSKSGMLIWRDSDVEDGRVFKEAKGVLSPRGDRGSLRSLFSILLNSRFGRFLFSSLEIARGVLFSRGLLGSKGSLGIGEELPQRN